MEADAAPRCNSQTVSSLRRAALRGEHTPWEESPRLVLWCSRLILVILHLMDELQVSAAQLQFLSELVRGSDRSTRRGKIRQKRSAFRQLDPTTSPKISLLLPETREAENEHLLRSHRNDN